MNEHCIYIILIFNPIYQPAYFWTINIKDDRRKVQSNDKSTMTFIISINNAKKGKTNLHENSQARPQCLVYWYK